VENPYLSLRLSSRVEAFEECLFPYWFLLSFHFSSIGLSNFRVCSGKCGGLLFPILLGCVFCNHFLPFCPPFFSLELTVKRNPLISFFLQIAPLGFNKMSVQAVHPPSLFPSPSSSVLPPFSNFCRLEGDAAVVYSSLSRREGRKKIPSFLSFFTPSTRQVEM